MKRRGQLVEIGAVVLAIVLSVAVVLFVRGRSSGQAPDLGPVIAKVGTTPIYLGQAKSRMAGLTSVHGDIEDTMGPDWHDQLLQSLVDDVLIQRYAKEHDIRLTDEELEAAFADVRDKFPDDASYQKFLVDGKTTEADLVRRISLNLLAARVYLDITKDVHPSHHETRAYYKDHEADYVEGDRQLPLLEVSKQIEVILDKQDKDAAFAAWLEEQHAANEPVIVMEDWWKDL